MKQELGKKRSEEGANTVSRVLYKEWCFLTNLSSDAALEEGSGNWNTGPCLHLGVLKSNNITEDLDKEERIKC